MHQCNFTEDFSAANRIQSHRTDQNRFGQNYLLPSSGKNQTTNFTPSSDVEICESVLRHDED